MSYRLKDCKHLNARDHIVGKRADGRRVWECSTCGAQDIWRKGWLTYGPKHGECPGCWDDGVEFVLCPVCAKKRKEQAA